MLSLLKNLGASWEQSRDGLYSDLEQIETILNKRWSATFGTSSTLGSAVGGTGTTTIFTKGSVVFAGTSGVYSQNNSKFFWDDTKFSLDITGRARLSGLSTYPVLTLYQTDASDAYSPFLVRRLSDGKAALYINSSGILNMNTAIVMCGNKADLGTIDVNGAFTPSGAVANGLSAMIDMYSDTDLIWAGRVSSAGGAYATQIIDPSGNYVHSIESDGSLKWGAGANHAAEDTTLARTAAGKLSLSGTTPMFQLGGTTSAFPAWKRSSATMMCRLADDSGYAELDAPTIHTASTFDFRLKQNGVDVIFSKESTALITTLWLEAGKVGVSTAGAPVAQFHVKEGSSNFIVGNNSFGNDWIVLSNDTGLSTAKYFLAESSLTGTILNARSGLIQSFRIANTEQMRLTTIGLGIGVTASAVLHLKAGTASASTAPFKFTSGTNLTTAEAGAMEYNGTNLFFTRSGTTREGVLTQSAVTTEALVSDTSVTVNINGTTYKLLARA